MTEPAKRTDAEKQAWAIYEMICATSADRPFAFQSVEQMYREIGDWKAHNPALAAIERAQSAVLLAFLDHSFQWIKAESKQRRNFRVTSTLLDAAAFALNAASHLCLPKSSLIYWRNSVRMPGRAATSLSNSF